MNSHVDSAVSHLLFRCHLRTKERVLLRRTYGEGEKYKLNDSVQNKLSWYRYRP